MKNYFFLLIIAVAAISCKNKEEPNDVYSYQFYPRKVSYLKIDMAGGQKEVQNGKWQIQFETSNCNPDTLLYGALYYEILDPPVPEVEKLIEQDYKRTSFAPMVRIEENNGKRSQWIGVEYRTSPIRNFIVYSLNTPLFGKPAGESLNDFFTIRWFYPGIISTPGYNMVYGYGSVESLSIKEWLGFHPLAPVIMDIAPIQLLSELPVDVQFVVEMETDEGLVLSDTTRVFTITE